MQEYPEALTFSLKVIDVFYLSSEIAPIATSKLPERLAPSRQDIYQGECEWVERDIDD